MSPRRSSGSWPAGRAAPGRVGHPALELALVDDPDAEHHVRMGQAAELRALPVVDADLLEGEVELVGDAGDRLPLEQGLRHVERVDDVGGAELDPYRLADRYDQLRDVAGAAD